MRSVLGEVVKLDRGYPLVRTTEGELLRCEHATNLVKGGEGSPAVEEGEADAGKPETKRANKREGSPEGKRAVIGDRVELALPDDHDKAIITRILPRTRELVRKDPTERAIPQVLAANFDRIVIAQALHEMNMRRLERELVLACETGAEVAVVLTKADLADSEQQIARIREQVQAVAGPRTETLVVSDEDPASVEAVRALMPEGTTTVLIGRSGVGKSSLINLLCGEDVQLTGSVRAADGKGRHTTVSRDMVDVPGGGRVVDMPGVRGLGLWEADAGIDTAFAEISQLAEQCRFRDCKHQQEPGCAVRAAVEAGEIPEARLSSYLALKQENSKVKQRREQARWKRKK